ncbi:MAG: DEAD/DEAH box helicase [bacterium]
MEKLKFEELGLSSEIIKAIKDMGFEETTAIQSMSIPHIIKGKDVIGQAQTGTGKTAAFGIPILEAIITKERIPQSMVLCPTRELAVQIAEELKRLAKYKRDISILPIYGGQPIERQIHALRRGVHIVIGTPGRVMDHLDRKTLNVSSVKMVVLDEADEMLDMGFRDDIEIILKNVPRERQTVFFSATMPRQFMELTKKYQRNPQLIKVVHEKLTLPGTEQIYYEVKENMKLEMLTRVIDFYDLQLALIFCNTKRKVDELVGHLQARGYSADAIHGDMNQNQRDRVMAKFRSGAVEILIATDVAARGIDVEGIEAVFNYDVPQDEEYYVHRIGRTGRAGKTGHAFTFVSGRDIYKIRDIQKYSGVTIKRKTVPTAKDVEDIKTGQMMEQVKEVLESKNLERYSGIIERFIGENHSSLDVACALLKMIMQPGGNDSKASDKTGVEKHSAFPDTGAESGMVRLFMNIGRSKNIRPGDIVGAIAGETGISGQAIGKIEVHDKFTFVEVPEKNAKEIVSIMKARKIKGNIIAIEPAVPKTF